jgi:hypothetical protein
VVKEETPVFPGFQRASETQKDTFTNFGTEGWRFEPSRVYFTKALQAKTLEHNALQLTVNRGEKSWRLAGEKCSALPEEMTRWSVAGSSLRGVCSLIRLCTGPA